MININREGGMQKYLGLPDQIRRRKKDLFTSVVDMIRQKMPTGPHGSCPRQESC